jgi:tetratricopeptide (TPR) repeat protein
MGRILSCCLISLIVITGSHSWSLAESGSIGVISDDSPETADKVLNDLVAMQSMVKQITNAEPHLPLRVFALKDQNSFKELAPERLRRGDIHTFGFSHTGPHTAFIAIRTDRTAALTAETLRHEYAHVLTAGVSPDGPAWLDEGLSEFWSAIAIEGDRMIAGRVVARHVELLRKRKWLPLDSMMNQRRGSLPSSPDQVALFYAQSWAMVHYLLLGQDANGLTQLLPSINELPSQFESILRRYVDDGQFRAAALPWRPPAYSRHAASTLSESRALAERANMLVSGEQPRSALPVARQSLAIDPKEPLALEVTGTYYFLSNQPEQARAWLMRALETGANSYGAAIYMSVLSTSPLDQERHLMAAIHARPDSDVAWERLGAIFERDGRLAQARRWCQAWSRRQASWLPFVQTVACGA